MAKIVMDKEEIDIPDNSRLMPDAEKLGIYFGCQDGDCGVCEVEVVEGIENLNELTEKEKEFRMIKNHRLTCQCRIKKGTIRIKL